MSFDVSSIFDGAQVGHNGRMQIEYIRFDKILPDDKNFYSMEDGSIQSLAGSIETIGLQQPLVVRPSGEAGSYIITSGHRRRAALEILWKADPMKWAEAPCIVQEVDELPEMTELRLLLANSDTRKMTDADLATQVDRIYHCLYKLKEQGMEFPGRMRDRVAEAVGVSKSKLSRLRIIKDGLQGDYLAEWQAGKLPETTAIALAKLEPALQDEIFALSRKTSGQTANSLDLYLKRREKVPGECKPMKESRCFHASVMREKMWKACSWESTCSGCCLDCDMLECCRESCSWCQAVIDRKAALKAETKAKRNEEKQKDAERAAPAVEYLSGVLSRTYGKMQERGLSAPELRKVGVRPNDFGLSSDLPLLMGCQKPKEDTQLPIGYGYTYGDCKGLIDAAEKLGCSIDWLLTGKESEFTLPASAPEKVPNLGTGWKDTEPESPGWYLVAYELIHGRLFYSRLYWTGSAFLMRESDPNSCIHASNLRYWIELPEGAENNENG